MEWIKPGLQISIESLDSVPENKLFIKTGPSVLELNYFINTADCQVFPDTQSSYLVYIKFEDLYFQSQPEFPFKGMPSHSQSICCNAQLLLLDLMFTNLDGIYRKLYLESKALELVLKAYSLHAEQSHGCENCRFLKFEYNKDKVQQARQILLDQLNNPPTIPELSKMLGLNQCYLKKGFKEMYNTTIYDFVKDQRMELAKSLIRKSGQNLNEISVALGYASISSFSKAFKKKHGLNPSELKTDN